MSDDSDPRFVETPEGARLAYHHSAGAAPTVVFLGGFASDMTGEKALFLEARIEDAHLALALLVALLEEFVDFALEAAHPGDLLRGILVGLAALELGRTLVHEVLDRPPILAPQLARQPRALGHGIVG